MNVVIISPPPLKVKYLSRHIVTWNHFLRIS